MSFKKVNPLEELKKKENKRDKLLTIISFYEDKIRGIQKAYDASIEKWSKLESEIQELEQEIKKQEIKGCDKNVIKR